MRQKSVMERRTFCSSAQRLTWLVLVLSISLCLQAAFASALSQHTASMQPGQFAELTSMTGWNNGGVLNPVTLLAVLLVIILLSTPKKRLETRSINEVYLWATRTGTAPPVASSSIPTLQMRGGCLMFARAELRPTHA